MDVATRLIHSITVSLFSPPSRTVGRSRDEDFGVGSRTFAVGEYIIVYCVEDAAVLIPRVVHGRRDLEALFD